MSKNIQNIKKDEEEAQEKLEGAQKIKNECDTHMEAASSH